MTLVPRSGCWRRCRYCFFRLQLRLFPLNLSLQFTPLSQGIVALICCTLLNCLRGLAEFELDVLGRKDM